MTALSVSEEVPSPHVLAERMLVAIGLDGSNFRLRSLIAMAIAPEILKLRTMPRPSTGHAVCEYRCHLCGGLSRFDGTPPTVEG